MISVHTSSFKALYPVFTVLCKCRNQLHILVGQETVYPKTRPSEM